MEMRLREWGRECGLEEGGRTDASSGGGGTRSGRVSACVVRMNGRRAGAWMGGLSAGPTKLATHRGCKASSPPPALVHLQPSTTTERRRVWGNCGAIELDQEGFERCACKGTGEVWSRDGSMREAKYGPASQRCGTARARNAVPAETACQRPPPRHYTGPAPALWPSPPNWPN